MQIFPTWAQIPNTFEGQCFVYNEGIYYSMLQGRKLHRIGGPAIWHMNLYTYYIHEKVYSEQEYWLHPLVIQKTLDDILSNDCVDNG